MGPTWTLFDSSRGPAPYLGARLEVEDFALLFGLSQQRAPLSVRDAQQLTDAVADQLSRHRRRAVIQHRPDSEIVQSLNNDLTEMG